MDRPQPIAGAEALLCAGCLAILIPLSFSSTTQPMTCADSEDRPTLKCPRCGQTYRWLDFSPSTATGRALHSAVTSKTA